MDVEQDGLEQRAALHAALGDPGRLALVERLLLGDASPSELGDLLGMPSNLVAHHLNALGRVGMVERIRSEGDGRRTYVTLVRSAVAGVSPLSAAPPHPSRVVFVCSHNSARSQLATAMWGQLSDIPTASAGTHPAPRVHPRAVRVARRHGLSLADARTAHVQDVVAADDLLVAVCDNAHEELRGDLSRLHWSVPDPVRVGTDAAFERAFSEIEERVGRLADAVEQGKDPK